MNNLDESVSQIIICKCESVDCKIHLKLLDPEGRYIKAEIKDKPVVLINVYAPNKNTELTHFFTNILTLLQNERL